MAVTAQTEQTTATLLGKAVHRSSMFSLDGFLERLFTLAFRDLVYPMIWEDPRVDMAALEITPSSRIVTIASGGCNVLSYLTTKPERIYAVDLNKAHIALNRLKLAAVQRLPDRRQLYAFLGTGNDPKNVDTYDQLLASHLDPETRAYWEQRDALGRRRIGRFGRGFYRYGLLGRCITGAHVVAWLYGRSPRKMMWTRTRTEQVAMFERELAPLFDKKLVRWALSHRAALYGLGIPPTQYAALIGDEPHMADVVHERLRKLACDFDIHDNYFAWAAFNRGFAMDGLGPHPAYLDDAHYSVLKGLTDRVSVELTSFTEFLACQVAASLDRFVLLDAQDWMGDQDLGRLWTEITRTARPGARVIFRTAGVDTILPGRVPAGILDRWTYMAARSRDLCAQDRSAIYGGFHLYVLKR